MAYIKLNRKNFYHNLSQIALKTGSLEKISIVLKDNAYGHGIVQIAKMASDFGIKNAVVRDEREAKQISDLFDSSLILGGPITPLSNCTYAINTLSDIADVPLDTSIELKVDTGMHRNGIDISQIHEALSLIKERGLNLVGLMTHYRSADTLSSELFWQQKQFEKVKYIVSQAGYRDIKIHSYNSATILRSKSFDEDMVRVGISAYGYSELDDSFDTIPLKPVLSLHAKKISTRVVKKSQRIGYGGDFIASDDMVVSTYDLGYGDGWCRGDSSRPYITPDGLSILGRVSMDMITLQSERDDLCIVSDAKDAAKQLDTISYEITTSLSPSIERIVV
ncbi:Alanine racemase [hydrothermal vent metagenome]|uniref:Alanine racemase n=1 Tax=hydrothermal vent metagenome TaxID=652676 RepID=A0A1W1BLW2_9ZZZZ